MKFVVVIERVIKDSYEVEVEADSLTEALDLGREHAENQTKSSYTGTYHCKKVTTKEPESK